MSRCWKWCLHSAPRHCRQLDRSLYCHQVTPPPPPPPPPLSPRHYPSSLPILTLSLSSSSRAEREAANAGQHARVNKLMSAVSSGQTDREGEGEGELTPALQQLCRQSDAAILVVDASHFSEDSKTWGNKNFMTDTRYLSFTLTCGQCKKCHSMSQRL